MPDPVELELKQLGNGWSCDMVHPNRPGSPPIGTGATAVMAVVSFFIRQDADTLAGIRNQSGTDGIKINGKIWKDAPSPKIRV